MNAMTNLSYKDALIDFEAAYRVHKSYRESDINIQTDSKQSNIQLGQIYLGMAQSLVQIDRFKPALSLFEKLLHLEIAEQSIESSLKGPALGGYTIALNKVGRYKQVSPRQCSTFTPSKLHSCLFWLWLWSHICSLFHWLQQICIRQNASQNKFVWCLIPVDALFELLYRICYGNLM